MRTVPSTSISWTTMAKSSTTPAGDDRPALILPHPRLAERAFVLAPLIEVAPDWRHPVSGATAVSLLAVVAGDQTIEPLSPAPTGA